MKMIYRLTAFAVLYVLALTAHPGEKTPLQRAPARTASAAVLNKERVSNNERARRAGAKLFARECAACHGPAGEGQGKALPLTAPEVGDAAPGALFWVLTNGSIVRGMPSFAHLPEAQRWQIVEYLKNLPRRRRGGSIRVE